MKELMFWQEAKNLTYTGEVDEWDTWQNISTFETEIKEIYKKGIEAEETEEQKQKLQEARDNKLTLLKDKIENLCFWDKIKTGDLEPISKRRAAYIKANKTQTRNMLPTPTEEETCLGNEFDAQEAAREKRYFPSNSKVYHFHPIAFVEQMKLMYYKPDIDLSDSNKWISQFTQPRPNVACYRTSVLVVGNYGVISGGLGNKLTEKYENDTYKYSNVIQTIIQMSDGSVKNTGDEKMAIEYIDQQLEEGNPIVIGVDKGTYTTFNKDNSTDHFVVITGRKTDKKGLYYRFFEVGTYVSNKELKGVNPNNRLYLTDDFNLIGKKPSSNIDYRLTQVRKNI